MGETVFVYILLVLYRRGEFGRRQTLRLLGFRPVLVLLLMVVFQRVALVDVALLIGHTGARGDGRATYNHYEIRARTNSRHLETTEKCVRQEIGTDDPH